MRLEWETRGSAAVDSRLVAGRLMVQALVSTLRAIGKDATPRTRGNRRCRRRLQRIDHAVLVGRNDVG